MDDDFGYVEEPVEEPKKNRTTLIIAIVIAVVLCCCCSVVLTGWFAGDAIFEWFDGMVSAAQYLPLA